MKSLAAAFGMEEKSGSAGSASAFGAHTSASTSISAERNVMVPPNDEYVDKELQPAVLTEVPV
ncbi:Uncharacterised protein [Mycobacteroides abscessus subsp. massiliense]|nr:Uncharacterised protein [Mycobacteroides abscessus subsp. massiliense]